MAFKFIVVGKNADELKKNILDLASQLSGGKAVTLEPGSSDPQLAKQLPPDDDDDELGDDAPVTTKKKRGRPPGKKAKGKSKKAPVDEDEDDDDGEDELGEDDDSSKTKKVTKADLLTMLNKIKEKHGFKKCKELLMSHGVEKLKELDDSDYKEFYSDCKDTL